jgi:hypothetical protein
MFLTSLHTHLGEQFSWVLITHRRQRKCDNPKTFISVILPPGLLFHANMLFDTRLSGTNVFRLQNMSVLSQKAWTYSEKLFFCIQYHQCSKMTDLIVLLIPTVFTSSRRWKGQLTYRHVLQIAQ